MRTDSQCIDKYTEYFLCIGIFSSGIRDSDAYIGISGILMKQNDQREIQLHKGSDLMLHSKFRDAACQFF